MNFKFILHNQINKKGEKPIYLRAVNEKQRVLIKTKMTIEEKFWNKASGKAKTTNAFPSGSELNNQLSYIEQTALNLYNRYVSENNTQPILKEFKKQLEAKLFGAISEEVKWNLFNFYEQYLKSLPGSLNTSTGRPISKGYITSHKQTLIKLKAFIAETKRASDFKSIDLDFQEDLLSYLNKKDYKVNYIGKQIKNLKTVLNRATIKGISTDLKYKDFKELTEDSFKLALTEDEVNELYELDLTINPPLELVRDIFVIGCWTGLRYSDLTAFSEKAKINGDIVSIKAQKTQTYVSVPLHPMTKEILMKYPAGFTAPSEQTFNRKIKELGKLLPSLCFGMNVEYTKGGKLIKESNIKSDLLQSHTARRTFATNMYKRAIPIETIMAITGHKKSSTFYKYVQLPPDHHAKKLAGIFNSNEN